MNALRRLAYRSDLLALARFLRLTDVLRESYYRWAVSPGNILRASLGGIGVQFRACTPAELRAVEGTLVAEQDFMRVLISTLRPAMSSSTWGAISANSRSRCPKLSVTRAK